MRLTHSKQAASVRAKIKQTCWRRIIIVLYLTGLIINIIIFGSTTVSARYVLSKQISFTVTIPSVNS